MNRKLQDGASVPAFDIPITLKVVTKCPEKWKLIDMETGQVYTGKVPLNENDLHWRKMDNND